MSRRVGGRREPRAGREAGVVGGVEMLPLAVLVFTAGMLLVANAWAVVDARLAAASAAREAVRTYVEATDPEAGGAQALAVARRIMDGGGRRDDRFELTWWASGTGRLARCQRVTATVSYDVPAISVPWLGGLGRVVTVSATASELVDPYRDGMEGVACGS